METAIEVFVYTVSTMCIAYTPPTWPQGRSAESWVAGVPSTCIVARALSSLQQSSPHALEPGGITHMYMCSDLTILVITGSTNKTDQFMLSDVNHELCFHEHF